MNIPVATYRIQFHKGFTFASANDVVSYLKDLGVSHVYASPMFKAKKGSPHGYDVIDPTEINPELGGQEEWMQLIKKMRKLGLGWIQDIVPNHMAFDSDNQLLMDVFERGEASPFYRFFDINWDHPYANLKGRTLVPFLGEFYGTCLDKGEILLGIDDNGFFIRYYDLKLPVSMSSYAGMLKIALALSQRDGVAASADRFHSVRVLFRDLAENANKRDAVAFAKVALWQAYTTDQTTQQALDTYLAYINSQKAESLDARHGLISEQRYRLSFWKVGNDELNYRRFFTVNSLICLKIEDADVFDYVHSQIFHLVKEGYIDGLRVDHVDGLYEPFIYLNRLRERLEDRYMVVEKILCQNEEMADRWPVQGTTGYDFLNYVNGLFVDANTKRAMEKTYKTFSGMHSGFESLVAEKKRLLMGKHMAGDIDNLAHLLKEIFSDNRYTSDFTMYGLRRALVEVMAHFPVYRTYASEMGISHSDRFYIKQALDKARHTGKDLLYELNAIEKVLLMDSDLKLSDKNKEWCRHFTKRFQQFSGALMAKGAEDTADYVYNRFISLNEVGGFPERFGVSIEDFHSFCRKRLNNWPHCMNATATHDTKRGEDMRARINILSEIPEAWKAAVKLWHRLNRRYKSKIDNELAPSNNDEYLIYQTLVGAFPFRMDEIDHFKGRMKQYIVKAVREAKIHTAWLKPDAKYEDACVAFIENILKPSDDNHFLNGFVAFQKKVAHWGVCNSLSQTFLKLTAPGVPDIYQGSDLWDFNLVDPDNRRPVDFGKRKHFLCDIKMQEGNGSEFIRDLLAHTDDGRIKLFAIYRLLKARHTFKSLFQQGEYVPLVPEGRYQKHVVAFARRDHPICCIAIAPRFVSQIVQEGEFPLGETIWQDTVIALPDGWPCLWSDFITGHDLKGSKRIFLGDGLGRFPVSLLIGNNS